jgi:dihydroorotate dehydrogenase (fumarate)
MKLATPYLGLKLRTPLVPSASPLSEKLDNIKRMEDAGAAAVVFHSLFEEQLRPINHPMRRASGNGGEFSRDALDDYSDEPDFKVDPEAYVDHIAKTKEAVRIPIIGSLNGSTFGGFGSGTLGKLNKLARMRWNSTSTTYRPTRSARRMTSRLNI